LKRLVGERGFEPPTPWSRTRCSTRLSHSPTEVSPFILLHVTSHMSCARKILKVGIIGPTSFENSPVAFATLLGNSSGKCVESDVVSKLECPLTDSRDHPTHRWLGAWRRDHGGTHGVLLVSTSVTQEADSACAEHCFLRTASRFEFGSFRSRRTSTPADRWEGRPFQDWVVYAKPPFGGPEHILQYLTRYKDIA
jgi:hypothetical protein